MMKNKLVGATTVLEVFLKITSQMTQGTRRRNQMEFKAKPNIAGECLDIFQYKI